MIPCRNKPHILPGYKPADLYSSLISIRCIAVCIAVDYKKGELTAAGLINEKCHLALGKACRNGTHPAFRQCDLIGAVAKMHRAYSFGCYELTKLLRK